MDVTRWVGRSGVIVGIGASGWPQAVSRLAPRQPAQLQWRDGIRTRDSRDVVREVNRRPRPICRFGGGGVLARNRRGLAA